MQPLALLIQTLDPVPDDNSVKAGWVAFAVFLLLILAVAFLCWSFAKQMRKVKAANEAGVYDDEETSARSAQVSERDQEQSGA